MSFNFSLGLPKNLLVAAQPSTGLSLVLDATVCDLLAPIGQCLIVAPDAHEAQLRLEQFRRHERAAHPDIKYSRYISTLTLNEYKNADAFAEAVENRIAAGKWASPAIVLRDAANELPLSEYDLWLQFLPRLVETLRVHCITAVSSGGSGRDLPDAALFDEIWKLTAWSHPDGQTPNFDSEVQLVAPNRKPLVFAAKDGLGVRTYRALRDKPRAKTGEPIYVK